MANLLSNIKRQAGLLLVGGLLTGSGIVGGISISSTDNSGNIRTNIPYVARDFVYANIVATGGNVKVNAGAKYDAVLVASPLIKYRTSLGSGAITAVHFDVITNPAGASFDCGFVKGAEQGTGSVFMNNINLAAGQSKTLSGNNLPIWNGADYIKCGTLTGPTSGFSGRLIIEYRDMAGE